MIKTTARFTNRGGASVRVVWHEVWNEGAWRWQCIGCQHSVEVSTEQQAAQQARDHAESCEAHR